MLADLRPSPRELFESEWPAIERVLRWVAQRNALNAEEAGDFFSHATLKLMEGDCAILRKFRGRSRLSTYLVTVVERLFLDYRISRWGKWRPSAVAKRAGRIGIRLDRLISCEGFSISEAVEILRRNEGATESAEQLDELARSLPLRPSRRPLTENALSDGEAAEAADVESVEGERRRAMRRVCVKLSAVLRTLPPEDRLILRLRFEEDLAVTDIARTLGLEPKPLYRRILRRLGEVKAELLASGLGADEIVSALGTLGAASTLHLVPAQDPTRAGARRSRP